MNCERDFTNISKENVKQFHKTILPQYNEKSKNQIFMNLFLMFVTLKVAFSKETLSDELLPMLR